MGYVNKYYKKRKYIVDLYNKKNALPNFSTQNNGNQQFF